MIDRSRSKSQGCGRGMEALRHPAEELEPADLRLGWLLLNRYGSRTGVDTVSVAGDARTAAESYTSSGWPFRVSFVVASPPASSILTFTFGGYESDPPKVIAAHGDFLLLELRTFQPRQGYNDSTCTLDYFLYEAGVARLPSLSLLPTCYIPMQYERCASSRAHRRHSRGRRRSDGRMLNVNDNDTVMIRRAGRGDLLVVQFEMCYDHIKPYDNEEEDEASDKDDEQPQTLERRINAELCVLRLGGGGGDWNLIPAVPIVDGEPASSSNSNGMVDLIIQWQTDAAIPVGDRFLCFVDYLRGLFLCDMAVMEMESSLTLRYVPLPVPEPGHFWHDERPCMKRKRNLSATMGASAVRFVNIDPRCCCGGPGSTSCARGSSFFTVTTWTLSLMEDDDEPRWVKDGVLDCKEVWGFPGYEGIPQVHLEYPIVSSDNPDIVCFIVCENHYVTSGEQKVWRLEVNLRSKELLSVIPCRIDRWRADSRVAAKLRW